MVKDGFERPANPEWEALVGPRSRGRGRKGDMDATFYP